MPEGSQVPRLEGPKGLKGTLKPTYHSPRRKKRRKDRDVPVGYVRLPNGKIVSRKSLGGSYGAG